MSAIANQIHPAEPARAKGSLVARATRKISNALRGAWRKVALNRNHVFIRRRGVAPLPLPSGIRLTRCGHEQDIPPQLLQFILARKGSAYLEVMRREFSDHGVLWLATFNGELAAYQWSRLGKFIPRWFVPIQPDDVLIFATVTMEAFRGKGIGPAMMCHIIAAEAPDRGDGYVDCAVWNQPAIRFIEKAGFTRIATMKPLPRVD